MPYDDALAARIRELVGTGPDVTEKPMFGGLAFLVGGNMAIAASGQGGLLVRCDPADTAALLAEPHTGPMEMRGRALAGWLRVEPAGAATTEAIRPWAERGVAYARSLPPKN